MNKKQNKFVSTHVKFVKEFPPYLIIEIVHDNVRTYLQYLLSEKALQMDIEVRQGTSSSASALLDACPTVAL